METKPAMKVDMVKNKLENKQDNSSIEEIVQNIKKDLIEIPYNVPKANYEHVDVHR